MQGRHKKARKARLTNLKTRFKQASDALLTLIPDVESTTPAGRPVGPLATLAVEQVAGRLHDPQGPLAPEHTVADLALARIPPALPALPTTGPQEEDPLRPRSAAPRFPQPMSEPLRQRFAAALFPGADEVKPDTVGVLVGNSRFIESYMVGLNDSLARELRWRDVPMDYGTTFFNRFWDASGAGPEAVPDIEPIEGWKLEKGLGEHAVRVGGPGMLVVLVRGELFRRYPHTIVYAVRADTLDDVAPVEKYPEFRGQIDPDLTFLGFGLGLDEARGGDGGPGWYFVLQEQPTAPRFGFDALPPKDTPGRFGVTPGVSPKAWEQVHWGMIAADEAAWTALSHSPAGGTLSAAGSLPLFAPSEGVPPGPSVTWGVDAGQTAAACLQQPFRVALHLSRMLEDAGEDLSHRVQRAVREGDRIVELAGVTASGEPWRLASDDVVDQIARGARGFVVDGRAGECPRLTPADLEGASALSALPDAED